VTSAQTSGSHSRLIVNKFVLGLGGVCTPFSKVAFKETRFEILVVLVKTLLFGLIFRLEKQGLKSKVLGYTNCT
jgi:hypothetical protein